MDWLKDLYPEVQRIIKNASPREWAGLEAVMEFMWSGPVITETMLPLASCRAVGADARDAVHAAAAVVCFAHSLRLYDDISDRDRPDSLWNRVGTARAWNYATALHGFSLRIINTAPLDSELLRTLTQLFLDASIELAAGQDRDIVGLTLTVDDYWKTAAMKSGCPYGMACAAGAVMGTNNVELIESCTLFGHHLGLTKQIFNDLESIWFPDGITDLQQGKVTLPVVYGLSFEHPDRDDLAQLVKGNKVAQNAGKIKAILDTIDAKAFLVWAAIKERDEALSALERCPDAEGKEALYAYITGMFGDLEELIPESELDPVAQ